MRPVIVGIAGGTGSGKTTAAQRIAQALHGRGVVVIPHDAYYHDIARYGSVRPEDINFDHPDALDSALLAEHLRSLRDGRSVLQPTYDFPSHSRKPEGRRVEPHEVILVEGILLFSVKEVRDLLDIRIFMDADADERLIRRIRRDLLERGRSLESVIEQYTASVKPMHREFVEPSKAWADVIVPHGAENAVGIAMVASRIRGMLAERT